MKPESASPLMPACPACGSPKVWPILYGEPPPPETWLEAYGTTELVIGGCMVAVDSPRWCCRACEHRWGVLERYDFANLADLLAAAVVATMWSVRSDYQGEGLADAIGELEQMGGFVDDEAEQARQAVLAALDGDGFVRALREMLSSARDQLAGHLVHLLRFAERKAADG